MIGTFRLELAVVEKTETGVVVLATVGMTAGTVAIVLSAVETVSAEAGSLLLPVAAASNACSWGGRATGSFSGFSGAGCLASTVVELGTGVGSEAETVVVGV